jgi:hypothetical protein
VSNSDATLPATVGRHYTITRTGPAACSSNDAGRNTFVADDPPRACAFGIDLLGFTLPGA